MDITFLLHWGVKGGKFSSESCFKKHESERHPLQKNEKVLVCSKDKAQAKQKQVTF